MKTYSFQELMSMHISKQKLSKLIGLEGITFDYALPQSWVDTQVAKISNSVIPDEQIYTTLVSTTFWVYDDRLPSGGVPITGCTEIANSIRNHSEYLFELNR